MERFIIGAALAAAAIFSIGAVIGAGPGASFTFSFGDGAGLGMEDSIGSGGAAATSNAQTFAAQKIRFEDGFAVVRIVPEDRTDIAAALTAPGALPAPLLRLVGDTLVIDGEQGRKLRGCHDEGVSYDGRSLSKADAPVITVQAPRAVVAQIGSAGFGDIGPSHSLDLSLSGCGDATLSDVAGLLTIKRAGAADVKGGAAGQVVIDSAGAGDIELGAIAGSMQASLSGAGSVTAEALQGDLTVKIAGSGEVAVNGGAVNAATTEISGSGDVSIKAPVNQLTVKTFGSGGVDVEGVVGDLDVQIAGSGDVSVEQVTGKISQQVMGSGTVEIARR